MGEGLTRRVVLRDGSAIAVALLASGPASTLSDVAVALGPRRAKFLRAGELETLRALVDRFIPGKPEDSDDGALAAGCAEAIDALLGAFRTNPPRIYAGAPFSGRGGSKVNHFKHFLRLDPYEELGWKLRIQGSRGRKKLEFNGRVKGWQQIYREGLAALNEAAGPRGFAAQPAIARDSIVRNGGERIEDLVDIAWPHTYQFMYGAPEYGGNKALIGWRYTDYDGDVQPRGYSRKQIEELDTPDGPRKVPGLGTSLDELAALAPLAGGDAAQHIVAAADGSHRALADEIEAVTRWARGGGIGGA